MKSCGVKHIPLSILMTYHRGCNESCTPVPHVEHQLPTLPEHLSSPHILSGVRVPRSSVFSAMFCRSLFALFLAIVLSVILRCTAFDYPSVSSNFSYLKFSIISDSVILNK